MRKKLTAEDAEERRGSTSCERQALSSAVLSVLCGLHLSHRCSLNHHRRSLIGRARLPPTPLIMDNSAVLRAVIFDCDGVIADTEPLHFATFRRVLAERGITLEEDEY